ncbi:MAG: hypothetical protein WCC57_03020 [Paracoccaceae bacterium]
MAEEADVSRAGDALFPEGQEGGRQGEETDHADAWPGDPLDQAPQAAAQTVSGAGAEPSLIEEPDAPASDLQALLDGIAYGDHNQDEADDLPDPAGSATDEPASIESVVAALGAAVTGQGWEGEAEEGTVEADWSHQGWADANRDEMVLRSLDEVEEAEILVSNAMPVADTWASEEDWGMVGSAALSPADFTTPPLSEEDRANLAEAEAVAEILEAESGAETDAIPEAVVDAALAAAAAAVAAKVESRIGVFDDEDAVVDEEVLRDLVRDIIREELQGALGERITRNVRKLVRAEINRAMATREFD